MKSQLPDGRVNRRALKQFQQFHGLGFWIRIFYWLPVENFRRKFIQLAPETFFRMAQYFSAGMTLPLERS